MKLLLDTHALLWWLADDQRLGPHVRALIGDPGNDILVSVVSLWEIIVKVRIGKLHAPVDDVLDAIERDGFVSLAIQRPHLKILAGLPLHHRDPFDHLLIAQAIHEAATFVSDDSRAKLYPVEMIMCAGAPPS